jgi:hypothetical protein
MLACWPVAQNTIDVFVRTTAQLHPGHGILVELQVVDGLADGTEHSWAVR